MARYHLATLSPTKPEILATWLGSQSWAPAGGDDLEVVGAYRFDDPDGRVGLEVHIVEMAGELLQVPLTYRDAPFEDGRLVSEMHHSVLGNRWVYDGCSDPVMVAMFAAAALTGTGQAIGIVDYEDRRLVVPTDVQLSGGGWAGGPVPVDGFTIAGESDDAVVLSNDRLSLRIRRRLTDQEVPTIGLVATWPGRTEPAVLGEVTPIDSAASPTQ